MAHPPRAVPPAHRSRHEAHIITARALLALLPRTAHVEVDTLRDFVPALPLPEAIPIALESAIAVTRILVRHGCHVVLTYPLGTDDHRALVAALADLAAPIYTVTLGPPLAVALRDRGARRLSDHERARIRVQYADERHRPPFGHHIDNAALTPEATAAAILALIGPTTSN